MKQIAFTLALLFSLVVTSQELKKNTNDLVKHIKHSIDYKYNELIIKSTNDIIFVEWSNGDVSPRLYEMLEVGGKEVGIDLEQFPKGRTIVTVRERGIYMPFSIEK